MKIGKSVVNFLSPHRPLVNTSLSTRYLIGPCIVVQAIVFKNEWAINGVATDRSLLQKSNNTSNVILTADFSTHILVNLPISVLAMNRLFKIVWFTFMTNGPERFTQPLQYKITSYVTPTLRTSHQAEHRAIGSWLLINFWLTTS